jgi:hypothetical protein
MAKKPTIETLKRMLGTAWRFMLIEWTGAIMGCADGKPLLPLSDLIAGDLSRSDGFLPDSSMAPA